MNTQDLHDEELPLDAEIEILPELVKTEFVNTIVDAGQEPMRIDKYLLLKSEGATRSKIQKAIELENVLVNDKPTRNNYKVKPHDKIIAYHYRLEGSDIIQPENIPLDIIFEDDDVLVINKNPGMVVHPGSGNPNGTLVNAVCYYLKQQMADVDELPRIGLVHRIDKDTSGLILFAKTPEAMVHLAAQFKAHTVQRKYLALVWGDVTEDAGTVNVNIGRHEKHRMQFDVYPDGDEGKHAITHFTVKERFGYVTLVNCKLETGRTHQIRVHMKHIGHTLFADHKYGGFKILKGTVYTKYKQFVDNCFALLPRQALHAQTIGFVHPTTGKELFFDSPVPQDIMAVLEKWRNYTKTKKLVEPD
jgi:23S rRNA pseudouridine1911/1915/1917 synthase